MDMGLDKLRNMVLDMAELSENTVSTAIDAYVQGKDLRERIYNWSEELRMLQDEVSELAVEMIARYQPVASDLRFIKSCMEIAYGFSRFGRYGKQAEDMIRLSIKAFTERNIEMASKLTTMDDVVDDAYLDFVKRSATSPDSDVKCMISGTLILRYLERIADHATYVGESVAYIVSGERAARK
jgi:phosphate transport system protein